MNNKNSETEIEVQTKRSEKQSSQPLERSYLYKTFRLKRQQVPVSSHFIFLSSVGIEGMHYHHLAFMAN